MGRYFLRRLLIYIPVGLLVTLLVFTLADLAPGDPADWLYSPELNMTYEEIQAIKESMGLNQSPVVRYVQWLRQTAQGNLGYRMKNGDPVGPLIATRLKRTLVLGGVATAFGIIVGLGLGIYTALHQYSWFDHLSGVLAFLGISMPAFFVGVLGLYIFGLKLQWFPIGGITTPGGDPDDLRDFLYHLILPAALLSSNHVAGYFRYMRMSMLEVLHADYLTTARAKGMRERIVILRHALRNALLPVVTVIGASIPGLFGGAVFIETIFSWPGMGMLFIDGVNARDYPLIMGVTLVMTSVILLANLLTDIAYSLVDPRIRLETRSN
ncbi:MAG: ABC transporter permease [Chloroflexi bacterium]|nr:ABC transporter permease [Chloroflexota bacterium]